MPESFKKELVKAISKKADILVRDKYANFVISEMLTRWNVKDMVLFKKELHGQMAGLATHKYASNVIERLIEYDHDKSYSICNELVNKTNIFSLMRSHFAVYVITKLIKYSKRSIVKRFLNLINSENILKRLNQNMRERWLEVISKAKIQLNQTYYSL